MFYRRWSNYIADEDVAVLRDKVAPRTLVAGATGSIYQSSEPSTCMSQFKLKFTYVHHRFN